VRERVSQTRRRQLTLPTRQSAETGKLTVPRMGVDAVPLFHDGQRVGEVQPDGHLNYSKDAAGRGLAKAAIEDLRQFGATVVIDGGRTTSVRIKTR